MAKDNLEPAQPAPPPPPPPPPARKMRWDIPAGQWIWVDREYRRERVPPTTPEIVGAAIRATSPQRVADRLGVARNTAISIAAGLNGSPTVQVVVGQRLGLLADLVDELEVP